jgi:hypothetical protein
MCSRLAPRLSLLGNSESDMCRHTCACASMLRKSLKRKTKLLSGGRLKLESLCDYWIARFGFKSVVRFTKLKMRVFIVITMSFH